MLPNLAPASDIQKQAWNFKIKQMNMKCLEDTLSVKVLQDELPVTHNYNIFVLGRLASFEHGLS